ncbi:MAG: GHKL domain-containing protein [Oscillospiraceae bacterium]|nr:GHKL domain-containing protein [Oscillospiraceae bacterium]
MNYLYFEIATVLFECLIVHVLFNAWFGLKAHNRTRDVVCYAIFFFLTCLITILPVQPLIRSAINLILVFCLAKLLYNSTIVSSLYSSLLFTALAVVTEYFCLVLLNYLHFDTEALMAVGNARAIYLVLAKSVHFLAAIITASVFRKNRATLTLKQILSLIPCLIVSIYICSLFYELYPVYEGDISLSLVIALVGLLYINGIIVLNTQSIKSTVVEIEGQKQVAQQYEMQEHYYRNVIKDREETRALWHDVKKHITAIEAIVGVGDINAANIEYDAIRQAFDKLGDVVDVENEVLNIILYHNIQRAKAHDIPVRLTAQVAPKISISAVDLSVVLGNTFDNAIDECIMLESESREISVSLIQRNNMLFYEIKNPCMEIPHKKSGSYHGYGIKNVNACVQKYNGAMERGAANGYYCVSIRLNCPS